MIKNYPELRTPVLILWDDKRSKDYIWSIAKWDGAQWYGNLPPRDFEVIEWFELPPAPKKKEDGKQLNFFEKSCLSKIPGACTHCSNNENMGKDLLPKCILGLEKF